jgi:hypothetical protein
VIPKPLPVIHDEENLMEILHKRRMRMKHELSGDARNQEKRVESRINLQPATDKESLVIDCMTFFILAEEQAGNQETA